MERLAIAHGEKLVLALVILLCGWWVWGTWEDPETISKADRVTVTQMEDDLEKAQDRPGQPNFQPVRDFHAALQRRLSLQVPLPDHVQSYLWEHPDLGKTGMVQISGEPYVYEVPQPELAVKARVGRVEVLVQLPTGTRPNEDRDVVKDDPGGVSWEQMDMVATADGPQPQTRENHARVVGLLIEMRVGNGAWQPYERDGVQAGYVPLTAGRPFTELALEEDIQAGQTYAFRARAVATATAPGAGDTFRPRAEVLVVSPGVPELAKDDRDQARALQEQAMRDELAVEAELWAEPAAGLALRQGRQAFLGVASDAVAVEAPSSVVVALERIDRFGGQVVGHFLVTKRFALRKGGEPVWCKPVTYKVPLGEPIGEAEAEVEVEGEGLVLIDLQTPYVFTAERQGERVLYYSVERKAQLGPPPGEEAAAEPPEGGFAPPEREFQMKEKTKTSDVAVLTHQVKEQRYELVQLQRLVRAPFDRPGTYYTPIIPADGIAEREAFAADPGTFELPVLRPPAPVKHADRQLLQRLAVAGVEGLLPRNVPKIEVPYFEMPDGRVIVYDMLRDGEQVYVIPGSEAAREGKKSRVDEVLDPVIEGEAVDEIDERASEDDTGALAP